jgi:O-antigen biosynthesis protein WbqP
MKRIFDLTLAILLLPFALILCLFVLPFIWIDCKVSPIFTQDRVGRAKKTFRIFKLRTMKASTSNVASHEVSAEQITVSGKLLRKVKLDELPQILNVLLGTMSFVGPRPCLPSQIELIREREALGVFQLRPGITGPAQIKNIDMSTPLLLAKHDSTYLAPWKLGRDIRILFATVLGEGAGDAALRGDKTSNS